MKFSYNWLKEYIPTLPKPDKLADLLNMHAFEVESIEKHNKDVVLDVNILPNRIADASGHRGLAREISAILGTPLKDTRPKLKESQTPTKDILKVEVKTTLCPRYTARVIRGVKVTDSPQWLKDRLLACGIRSINNIVDATNYVMLDTGQPLHAFDLKKISGAKIIVRLAKRGEKIHALDDTTYALDESMIVIADAEKALAIAGIKGGATAEISPTTHEIIIEAATFDGPTIRMTSQKIKLKTDASARFSVGMDPNLTSEAMERVAALVVDIAGGEVLKTPIDVYPKRTLPAKIVVRTEHVRSVLGEDIKDAEMISILKRLGFEAKLARGVMTVLVPTYRVDVRLEEDVIEEIGRLYGFEHIVAKHPMGELVPSEVELSHVWTDQTKDIIAGLGFREAYNYSFIGESEIAVYHESPENYLEIENPTRREFAYLRRYLLPGLLRNMHENLKHEPSVRMFEMGRTYHPTNTKDGYTEKNNLGLIMAERSSTKDANLFYELKGVLATYFEGMGVDVWFDEAEAIDAHAPYHPFRRAALRAGDDLVGVLGEVHPVTREELGIKATVVSAEIDFDRLARYISAEKEFKVISKYPSIMRDLAILVPLETRVEEVTDVIENTGGELLVDSDLFDMYEGSELPHGKQSLAFRLVFQAQDRTLKDTEVDAIMTSIIKTLETNLEWETR
ncbi:MAG: phenylalanine--tRNA ligase subunit beta [Candidatus Ryanbacteria bacterium RIFCSPHIGHO2_02_FULL_45_17b]|uniref:Phenylalanine--tRNA ligase beta subunit n=1 Tax=Candidatus Ryanbacteria bacterium RIFCSPHIGHO2_01_FULL_45_22 TaxID=1802114 RepID=A0A1G2G251_9BACT|nr:MAG: phenylalanine--tRNA ligase subunit beta [Candidatus Ryanbacteria bacterium RIFCSPHIGHO2_01_FULL_45_22]OGZ47104.1 MAG: phenylalanine--tRNA ligase subunit beta [Candidatus Ryanbacteria bacterium RIFCSPHIGHO2_02_FULL_45_17b]